MSRTAIVWIAGVAAVIVAMEFPSRMAGVSYIASARTLSGPISRRNTRFAL